MPDVQAAAERVEGDEGACEGIVNYTSIYPFITEMNRLPKLSHNT